MPFRRFTVLVPSVVVSKDLSVAYLLNPATGAQHISFIIVPEVWKCVSTSFVSINDQGCRDAGMFFLIGLVG